MTAVRCRWIYAALLILFGAASSAHRSSEKNLVQKPSFLIPNSRGDIVRESDFGHQLSSIVQSIRGGASEVEEKNEGFLVKTLRKLIRGLLGVESAALQTLVKSVGEGLEQLMGVRLLPRPTKQKKKSKSKKNKKSASKKLDQKKKKKKLETRAEDDGDAHEPKVTSIKPSGSVNKASVATKKHLASKLKPTSPNYRIQKELKEFLKAPPPNLSVKVGSNIRIWIVTMVGTKGSVYEDEVYKLRVQFPKDYPIVPPSVYFLPPTPKHEHVYTNGDICLSLLGDGWRPTMTAQSIAVSILSILSSAKAKGLPMDNARHSQNKPGQYQKDWVYHDDNC